MQTGVLGLQHLHNHETSFSVSWLELPLRRGSMQGMVESMIQKGLSMISPTLTM